MFLRYNQPIGNLSEISYLFGKINFVVYRKARKFKGTNQYKKEDIRRKSFLKKAKLHCSFF